MPKAHRQTITGVHFLHTSLQTFQEKIIFAKNKCHEQLQAFISLPDSRPVHRRWWRSA